MEFEFHWEYADFEIRTKKAYHRDVPYIELVKWETDSSGRRSCFTLAYWYSEGDDGWDLRFVGDRPWRYIAELDVSKIWKQLFLAQEMLEDALRKENEDKD